MREDFEIGERVEIICWDGAIFQGVLLDFTEQYLILSPGLGFPLEDIDRMERL